MLCCLSFAAVHVCVIAFTVDRRFLFTPCANVQLTTASGAADCSFEINRCIIAAWCERARGLCGGMLCCLSFAAVHVCTVDWRLLFTPCANVQLATAPGAADCSFEV